MLQYISNIYNRKKYNRTSQLDGQDPQGDPKSAE